MTTLITQDVVPPPSYRPNRSEKNRRFIPIGMRFGSLLVIDNCLTKTIGIRATRLTACLCRCDCGTEKILDNRVLRSGITKSCGPCGAKGRMPDSDWRAIRHSVKSRARAKGIEMTLTARHIQIIGELPCSYCRRSPQNVFRRVLYNGPLAIRDKEPTFLYSGIDRVDPSKGYIPGNVMPCCKFCNYAKTNYTLEEFIGQISRYGSELTANEIYTRATVLLLIQDPESKPPNLGT